MIGRQIAHYKIVDRLGAGGMGVVYRARDEKLHRDVAIKVLSPALTENDEARERFLREARSASSLDHPNVGAIYAIEEGDEGELFLVMALYEGQPLDHALRTRRFEEPELRTISRQLFAGLAAAHARGIVHRDIKPSNLFLTESHELKILDFGLARIADSELTRTDTSVGSPAYMSPEQARGAKIDTRSDLWSAGVLLLELLTGENPFRRETLSATIYAITQEEADVDLPGGTIGEVIRRCLAREPERRAASASELLALLEGSATASLDATQQVHLESTQRILRPRRKRQPLLWASAILLTALVVWLGVQLRPQAPPLSVAVLPPVWEAPATDAEFLASNARDSILRALSGQPSISILDPREVAALGEDDVARLHPERILRSTLADRGSEWSLRLELLEPQQRRLIEQREFRVPKEDPWRTSLAIQSQALSLFGELDAGAGSAGAVRDADYARYLSAQNLFWSQSDAAPLDSLLAEMEDVARTSPRFAPAMLLGAELATYLYDLQRDEAYFERARTLCEQAIAQLPDDAAARVALARAAIFASDAELAGQQIQFLRAERPFDPAWLAVAAEWEQLRGNADAARDWMRQAAERMPTRRNRFELARLLNKQNRYDQARATLRALIADDPEYRPARSKLAEIELLEGDPQIAVDLCDELLADGPEIGALVNRGLAYSLLRNFEAASADFGTALSFAPGHPYLLLNAADGETMAGRVDEGRALYRRALDAYEGEDLVDWQDELVVAQCQVHLGLVQEALGRVQSALSHASGSAEAHYLAALVHCVAGERQSALLNARLALEAGQQPRWFGLPWFDELQESPEFRQLFVQP